ncbi:2-amino-4-hydroxy-6-hydroxymethyldihydropteridine diphosphokinase [Bacillus sp. Marseille-P3661]|uniref:2-amino-4-hydroxy-6- hydroxymethyldihydropteridine diphosphokinase n=1 Tax=Bacillus sp. Marseille-P3661 TaxID=1936234 RepID=UPI000C82966E|nr:2-amino-4-hydroxy-6-hydroxymethyldihydropteridine diphosphokinase [Bacillus sp. Marseille-P3661]
MKNEVYVALGTNQGDRLDYIKSAIKLLDKNPGVIVVAYSSIYETEPVGFTDQPNFLNMVLCLNTTLNPYELIEVTQEIENALGRKREQRWGPRTIDLDILLFNDENIESEQLIVPHPRMFERAFVIIPLLEINEGLIDKYHIDTRDLPDKEGIAVFQPKEKVAFTVVEKTL